VGVTVSFDFFFDDEPVRGQESTGLLDKRLADREFVFGYDTEILIRNENLASAELVVTQERLLKILREGIVFEDDQPHSQEDVIQLRVRIDPGDERDLKEKSRSSERERVRVREPKDLRNEKRRENRNVSMMLEFEEFGFLVLIVGDEEVTHKIVTCVRCRAVLIEQEFFFREHAKYHEKERRS
jgi:hypothetical protein